MSVFLLISPGINDIFFSEAWNEYHATSNNSACLRYNLQLALILT